MNQAEFDLIFSKVLDEVNATTHTPEHIHAVGEQVLRQFPNADATTIQSLALLQLTSDRTDQLVRSIMSELLVQD